MSDSDKTPRNQRIVEHMRSIHQAAGDDDAHTAALNAIRDDHKLTDEERKAIYKTLAQQALIWYVEACTGESVDVHNVKEKLMAAQGKG